MITIYTYAGCSTCRKAIKFLDERGMDYRQIAIVDEPPGFAVLKKVLARLRGRGRDLKHLFNTSGERYRTLKMGERLKEGLTDADALSLLAADGKLIKRPVLLTPRDATAGFDPGLWTEFLSAI